MLDITLEVPLRLLAFGGNSESHDATGARIQPLGDALDYTTLAGGVAALEDDDHLETLVTNPLLQLDEVGLQLPQLGLVICLLEPTAFAVVSEFFLGGCARVLGHSDVLSTRY